MMIVDYLPSIALLAGIVMVALISPGPDFAIIVRNSLVYSRKTAFFTAFGLACGTLVHAGYSMLGLGFLIKKNLWLLILIKYLGATYLIYLGYKGLRAKKATLALGKLNAVKDISVASAILNGFLTNILNPKCILFFVSLSSMFVNNDTPLIVVLIYAILTFVETFSWFSFVAFFLSTKRSREKFSSIAYIIERLTGGVLTLIGVRLLLSR